MRTRKHLLLPVLILLVGGPNRVEAADTGYQVILQGQHANNVNETSVDPQSDITASAIGQFNISQLTSKFFLSGLINGEYNNYLEDTFGDELLVRSIIIADWFWTDSLAWRSRNVTNQVQLDQLTPDLPNNRSNQNLFSTGPELIAAVGQANRFTLGANYAISTISDSPNDSDRVTGYTQFRRTVARPLALSVNYRAQDVMYDDIAGLPDYRLSEAFFRAEWTRGSLSFQGDWGVTYSDVDGAVETTEDDLVDLLLRYERGAIGTVTGRYRWGVGDSTTDIDSPLFDPGLGQAGPNLADSGLFREERYSLNWIKRIGRLTGNASAAYRDQDFLLEDSDQIIRGVSVNIGWQINPRWQVGVGAGYERNEFLSISREDEARSAALRLTRSFGDRFSVFLEGEYVERDSTDEIFIFDDTRVTLGIVFQGGIQPSATMQRRSSSRLPPGNLR